MASATHVIEKRIAHQNQQQQRKQAILKCPRCNSSNTKFCYYNNYSLSQPRHFCKACKRYWTSGGTLRNVPVGGSCRKNKRIKTTFTTTGDHNSNPNCNCNLDLSTPSNNKLNPLYGSLLQNPKYPRFNTRVSGISDTDVSRYDLIHPQMNSLRLGFSSSDPGASLVANHVHNSTSLVTSYPSMLSGGLTANCNNDNTMASLLSSSLQQQPTFMGFAPYGNVGGSVVKDDTIVGTKGSTDWNNSFNGQNDNDQMNVVESCDPTSFLWTITGGYGGERA